MCIIEDGRYFVRKKTDKVGGLEFKLNNDTNLSPPARECEAVDPVLETTVGQQCP